MDSGYPGPGPGPPTPAAVADGSGSMRGRERAEEGEGGLLLWLRLLQLLLDASILLLLMEPGAAEDGGFAKATGSRDPAAWDLLLHLSPKLYLA